MGREIGAVVASGKWVTGSDWEGHRAALSGDGGVRYLDRVWVTCM